MRFAMTSPMSHSPRRLPVVLALLAAAALSALAAPAAAQTVSFAWEGGGGGYLGLIDDDLLDESYGSGGLIAPMGFALRAIAPSGHGVMVRGAVMFELGDFFSGPVGTQWFAGGDVAYARRARLLDAAHGGISATGYGGLTLMYLDAGWNESRVDPTDPRDVALSNASPNSMDGLGVGPVVGGSVDFRFLYFITVGIGADVRVPFFADSPQTAAVLFSGHLRLGVEFDRPEARREAQE